MTSKIVKFNKSAGHPLQSWEWGEFRKRAGNEIVRSDFGQITIHPIPFTNLKVAAFLKGPKPTKEMVKELKDLGNEENLIFVKLEPNYAVSIGSRKVAPKDSKRVLKLLRNSGVVSGRTHFTPTTFWIDLTRSEDELMKSFHHKTRYNIRLAQKKGVKIVEDNSKKAFDRYIELTRQTVERQGFYAHTEKYHRLMWQVLHKEMKNPIARLLTAHYKGEIITTWIVFVWQDFLYYPYGASSDKHRNVMANNLIMWEAILYGKGLGLKTFDLWGQRTWKRFYKV